MCRDRWHRIPTLSLVALALLASACDLFRLEAPLPPGAVRVAALPQYGLWWRLTERCSGITRDMAPISWYVVPGADTFIVVPSHQWVNGVYSMAEDRIVLAGHSRSTGDIVRHEMLHALLRRSGHPPEYFQDRCGGVVRYTVPPMPIDSTAPIVRTDDLVISARADSTAPSLARDSFYVALTVTIRNPRATPVRVRLTPMMPGYFASETFGLVERYCNTPAYPAGEEHYFVADSTLALGPGEVRRQVFDRQTGGVCMLYQPYFNVDTLPDIRVVPVP